MSSMSPETVTVPTPLLVTTDGKTYPLREAQLLARAEGGHAFSTLVQVFDNPHDESLEVTYRMPLPVDGAVLGYTVTVGERVIRGTIRTREEAKRAFDEAISTGRVAGLLEEERGATFTQSLGNIPARTSVKVAIEVLQPLGFLPSDRLGNAASWEYRFPTVLGVRFSGEAARAVEGAVEAALAARLAWAAMQHDDRAIATVWWLRGDRLTLEVMTYLHVTNEHNCPQWRLVGTTSANAGHFRQ